MPFIQRLPPRGSCLRSRLKEHTPPSFNKDGKTLTPCHCERNIMKRGNLVSISSLHLAPLRKGDSPARGNVRRTKGFAAPLKDAPSLDGEGL